MKKKKILDVQMQYDRVCRKMKAAIMEYLEENGGAIATKDSQDEDFIVNISLTDYDTVTIEEIYCNDFGYLFFRDTEGRNIPVNEEQYYWALEFIKRNMEE